MQQHALSSKQRVFVQEYLIDKNASRAYIAAGYAHKGARQAAHKLLTNTDIQQAVETGLKEQMERANFSAERVLQAIAEIAYGYKKAKISDKLRALQLLGKHLGMFNGEGAREPAPQIVTATEEQIRAAIEKARNCL